MLRRRIANTKGGVIKGHSGCFHPGGVSQLNVSPPFVKNQESPEVALFSLGSAFVHQVVHEPLQFARDQSVVGPQDGAQTLGALRNTGKCWALRRPLLVHTENTESNVGMVVKLKLGMTRGGWKSQRFATQHPPPPFFFVDVKEQRENKDF